MDLLQVWSENINLALDIAPKVKAGVIWINSTNLLMLLVDLVDIRKGFWKEGGFEGIRAIQKLIFHVLK